MKNILLLAVVVLSACASVVGFRIGAFNVQVFGASKAKKKEVLSILSKIIQRYDILLIQEIRDSKQTAIVQLLAQANKLGPATYAMVVSTRLGRTRSKEQYAFLYRNTTGIRLIDTYQYPDVKDEFEREPYAVKFRSSLTTIRDFVLAGVHVDPDEAVQEINSLVAVHDDLQQHWDTDNILIMGDFNADCRYVAKRALPNLWLRADKYHWFIGDDLDTTTKSTDCAYDRLVMTGSQFLSSVVPGSAGIFHFDTEYRLDSKQTTAVSDHFPVELELSRLIANKPQASSGAELFHPLAVGPAVGLAWCVWYSLLHGVN